MIERSGRWRSKYVIDLSENTISGKILVNIHYYEQGNVGRPFMETTFQVELIAEWQVQLATAHDVSLALPIAVVTSSPIALIEDEEGNYQTSLNTTYHEMGEKTFKGLRRALPLTRQKLDWDKVRCVDSPPRCWLTHLRYLVTNLEPNYLRARVFSEIRSTDNVHRAQNISRAIIRERFS
jgi:hypothetical protein